MVTVVVGSEDRTSRWPATASGAHAPNIIVQVLPKSVSASPALEGPFSVLTPPEPMPDIGYSEGAGRAVYVEDRDAVRAFTLRFGILGFGILGATAAACAAAGTTPRRALLGRVA